MKGRPELGAIFGFLFGVFLAVTLQQWSVRPLETLSVIGSPIAGLGLLLAQWAPFGRTQEQAKRLAPDHQRFLNRN